MASSLLAAQNEFSASSLSGAAIAAGITPYSLAALEGLSSEELIISGDTADVSSQNFAGGGATSTIQFLTDGTGRLTPNPGGTSTYNGSSATDFNWITTQDTYLDEYEIRATATGDVGSISGTLNTYLSLGTDRSWAIGVGSNATASATLTITIREKINTSNSATMTVTLSAEASSI